jgi:hypothetical protein
MSQITDSRSVKIHTLEELRHAHAKILIIHAFRAQFNREPNSHENTYWANFLLSGGNLRDLLKRLPEGLVDGVAISSSVVAPIASTSSPIEALSEHAPVAPLSKRREEIKLQTGAHQGVITLVGKAGSLYAGRPAKIHVIVENLSAMTWVSGEVQPVFACYHWIDQAGNVIIYDGIRSRLPEAILPASRKQVPVSIIPPPVAGDYTLEVTLVHEQVTWMEEDGLTTLRLDLTVDPSLSESGLKIQKELQWAKESAAEKFLMDDKG